MEEKLTALITRIEQSALSVDDKTKLYTLITSGLQATVWPALVNYVDKAKMDALLTGSKDKFTVEVYAKLIDEALASGKAEAEIEDVMNGLLNEIDAALREENI